MLVVKDSEGERQQGTADCADCDALGADGDRGEERSGA
jgi:hypothetical protein